MPDPDVSVAPIAGPSRVALPTRIQRVTPAKPKKSSNVVAKDKGKGKAKVIEPDTIVVDE